MARDDIKQHPLITGTRSHGMLNVSLDGSEIRIVPEKPIPVDSKPVASFLISRVLEPMKAKHDEIEYQVDADGHGMLRAIFIHGTLLDSQVKELISAAKWAFERAEEPQTNAKA